ncbi:hypothetical protein HGRIS_009334 [Hohenbuehelia grisea]|uniref:Ubiquitin carboxyl-terminal hydrolase n=1 Tax=Hohenbuehelia grisea TaxID=104357 RepID=A0ABR3J174_9AGAR
MLAQPLVPPPAPAFSPKLAIVADTSDEQPTYRPARDIDAFNSLLPPPIRFIEASSSTVLAGLESKYTPINAPKQQQQPGQKDRDEAGKEDAPSTSAASQSVSGKAGKHANGATSGATEDSKSSKKKKAERSLHSQPIDTTWLPKLNIASGLNNTGNSCFLNSALQVLMHTPPLLRILATHLKDQCDIPNFCMACALRETTLKAHTIKRAITPTPITSKLNTIAKHLRRGRQEDSHEFLRYAIDALQKSCLFGLPPKVDPKLAETSWVHKIFGGRLRSRVTCGSCGYNSDTYDSILDLSLDIHNCHSLKDALRKFVAIDQLKGADKYKCERCKKPVVAEKRFTVHEAPIVLTVHLKRFSPLGKKIGHHVNYDESLSLRPVMSDGQYGPSYSLYGVICHAGGGPNSGHYFAHVRSREGRWYEMNDESVTPCRPPTGVKNAYMLFYLRNKGEGLEAAVAGAAVAEVKQAKTAGGVAAAMKKRHAPSSSDGMDVDLDEDIGEKVSASASGKPFIGPLMPSPMPKTDGPSEAKKIKLDALSAAKDPQALKVKQKIEASQKAHGLSGVMAYASDASDDSDHDADDGAAKAHPSSPATQLPPPSSPAAPSSPIASTSQASTIPATSFYGSTATSSSSESAFNEGGEAELKETPG